MNMMQMVAVMVICYFVTLALLAFYRHIINVKVGNILFIIVDVIFFLWWTYAEYLRGSLNWGFMTFDNISPFIMTLIPLTLLFSDKVREYCNSAIAFLWMGMFVALLISPQHAYIFNYKIEASLLYSSEAACHLLASLYGAYLILTKQVKCDFAHWKKAIICMYLVIGFGIIMNFIFHRDFFGMDPYGQASIYMIDIFGSFEATLAAYLLGVMLVLTLGLQAGFGFFKLVDSAHGSGELSELMPEEAATVGTDDNTQDGKETVDSTNRQGEEKE